MSEWTEIIEGLAGHIALLKELGERTVEVDPAVMRALAADAGRIAGVTVRVTALAAGLGCETAVEPGKANARITSGSISTVRSPISLSSTM